MNTTKWMLASMAAVCTLAGAAYAQVEDAAKKALGESTQAMSKLESMTYKVNKKGTGALEKIIDVDGEVKFWRPAGAKTPMVYVKGRVKNPGSQDKQLEVSYDGQNVTWLDWSKNTKFVRPVTDMSGKEDMDMSHQFILEQFLRADPFALELSWPTLKKTGVEKVNGEMCDVITANPAPDRESVWAISVADRLPRRYEQGTPGPNSIGWVTNISDLKTGVKYTAKDFEIALPPGFVEDAQIQAAPGAAPQLGVKIGDTAPGFTGTDAAGNSQTLASLKGNVVVLQFFGTMFKASAGACAEVQALADEMKGKKVVFLGVACRELGDTEASEFWKKNKFSYPCITKGGDDIAKSYKVMGYPSVCIIGADGTVKGFHQDNPGKDVIANEIRAGM